MSTLQKSAAAPAAAPGIEALRADFPILHKPVYDKRLVYLDSAASAQKPQAVIDAVNDCYTSGYANVHRAVYYLAAKATESLETAREKVRGFLNAQHAHEIIFVRGATEGINLLAQSYGRHFLAAGDEIVLSEMEHHSNIVPWQFLRDQIGVVLKIVPITDDGALDMAAFEQMMGPRTKLVAITHVSNALGTVTPIADIIRIAHAAGAKVLVDGCQAVPHMAVDVQALDADFYVLSGHKIYGPSGIGVLYGKEALLDTMPPYQGGGEMIASVTFEKTTYAALPHKFEAGTPHIAGAAGLGAAVDYLTAVGFDRIAKHEHALLDYAVARLGAMNDVRLIGTAPERSGVISFIVGDIHPHDVGTILDREGVAVRVGHHCAQPVMDRFGVAATVRASFGLYNTREDVDALIDGIARVKEIFG